MKISEFFFQLDMITGRARDIACTARSCSRRINRGFYSFNNAIILTHAEIVIGTPYSDVLLIKIVFIPRRTGECPLLAPDVSEDSIAAFFTHRIYGSLELIPISSSCCHVAPVCLRLVNDIDQRPLKG